MTRDKKRTREPLTAVLATYRKPRRQGFEDAWVGLEPTFQTRRSIELYKELENDDDRYFVHPYMLRKVKKVARGIERKVEKALERTKRPSWCLFDGARVKHTKDKWGDFREQIDLRWKDRNLEELEVKFGMDPFTFEYGIKPVPLQWLYDERFVRFFEKVLFGVPRKEGMTPSLSNGGGQFHFSVKTVLSGCLLADIVATTLNHPELSTWTLDWPNCDDRSLRATAARKAACERMLDRYWAGAFHPLVMGVLTAEHVLYDRGFSPVGEAPRAMDAALGPRGDARAVFQTNFAFGRAVADHAQGVDPGYWQLQRPDDDGYRPEQIMRYSEINLLRLQIAGELHVKDFEVLSHERIPEAGAPLELSMLADEASIEYRRHTSRVDARDYVEALLFEVHHAMYLARHPHVRVVGSLLQDQLHGGAEETIRRHAGAAALARLHKKARADNLVVSKGRLHSDYVEPETLFFEAFRALPEKERGAIAREAVGGFVQMVEEAASVDPRDPKGDPMEAHRHRVHPLLWGALERAHLSRRDPARRELEAWQANRSRYLARRPVFSQTGDEPPWKGLAEG